MMFAALACVAGSGASAAQDRPFAERSLGLVEDCLEAAVADADDMVSETDDSHKYMCIGEPAERLWAFLGTAGGSKWVQQTEEEGTWDSRGFPLGGCFRRIRNDDGTPATDGLSCSIWIPRPSR